MADKVADEVADMKVDKVANRKEDMVADMKVDKVANMVVDMDFSMIFLYFMVKYFGVTRLERPKAVKDDVKQARRA